LTLAAAESRHALAVLRLRPGDTVEVFDGQGAHAMGKLVDDGAGRRAVRRGGGAVVEVGEVWVEPPPGRHLTLYVAACKGPRLDWLVEKCTELGVDRIRLVEFARSVVRAGDARLAKLSRVAIEACKQCGRNRLPQLSIGDPWPPAPAPGERLVVCDPEAPISLVEQLSRNSARDAVHLTAVIGPEGGLADDERAHLHGAGAVPVRLAPHVLRVETAAVAVAAVWAAAPSV